MPQLFSNKNAYLLMKGITQKACVMSEFFPMAQEQCIASLIIVLRGHVNS